VGTVNLERALRPAALAFVRMGQGRLGERALQNLLLSAFSGQVYCIGEAPPAATLQPVDRIGDLPSEGTLLVVDAPYDQVPRLVQQAAEAGLPGVLILSREAPSDALRTLCRQHPYTRVIGPGSRGLIIPALGLNASLHRGLPGHGGLAMISSSPSLWDQLLLTVQCKGLGLSHLICLGEQVDVDAADIIDYLHGRGRVRCLALDAGTVPAPGKLLPAVWSFARDRPLIVRSPNSGWDWTVFSCALRRAGAIPLRDEQELLALLETTCRLDHPPPGPQAVPLCHAGEPLIPEEPSHRALHLTLQTRRALLGLGCSISRTHVSMPADADEHCWLRLVRLLLDDPCVHMLLLRDPPGLSAAVAAQGAAAAEIAGKPLVAATCDAHNEQALTEAGIAVYRSASEAHRVLSTLASYVQNLKRLHRFWGRLPTRPQQRAHFPTTEMPTDELRQALARWEIAVDPGFRSPPQDRYAFELRRHAVFGAVLSCTNLDSNSSTPAVELPPLSGTLARSMVSALSHTLSPREEQALVHLLIQLSQLASDVPHLVELELSPVVISKGKAVALHARARVDTECPDPHLCLYASPLEPSPTVLLKDGTPLTLRPIRPDDAPYWRRMLTNSSSESLRLRYHSVHHAASRRMARRHCCIDYRRELVIVAEARGEGGTVLAGEGELFVDSDRDLSEFAVFVADPWQGKGLGSTLTDYMVDLARDLGTRRVTCELTPDNVRMIKLLQRRGFAVRFEMEDGVVFAVKDLSQPPLPQRSY